MDSTQKTTLLLEMNLRLLSTNLQLTSLVLSGIKNENLNSESQQILKNLLNWLRTLNQYAQLPETTNVLVEGLIDSVKNANSFNFDPKIIGTSVSSPIVEKIVQSKVMETISNIPEIVESQQISSEEGLSGEITKQSSLESDSQVSEEEENNFFNRQKELNDQWDYISSISTFMSSYSHIMHLLIPNLAFELATELNRYSCDNNLLLHDSITHPTLLIQSLITKLLREAPGSNLFRRIRRNRIDAGVDINFDQRVNISESEKIKNMVQEYFTSLTKYLDPSNLVPPMIDTLYEKTRGVYQQFSLGGLNIETRLTAVVKNIAESSFKEAEEIFKNEMGSLSSKVIYLASTKLFCDFQSFLLHESRIVKFLEDLKG